MATADISKLIEYTVECIPVNTNGQAIEANCVDIMFVNYGTSDMFVNTIKVPAPIIPGQLVSFRIAGNYGEIDRTKYVVRFATGGTNNGMIIRRNYK